MKKLLTITLISLMVTPQVHAESKVMEYLKDYGLPCLVSLGAGLILAPDSQTGGAIGGAGCLGIGTATYLQKQREAKEMEFKQSHLNQIQGMIDKSSVDKNKEIDEHLKQIDEAQKAQIDELKSVLREVIAEKMLSMQGEMKDFLTQKMESGELMPKLEANLKEALKGQVVSAVKAEQKAVVEKCVEETIKEVIAKPIGVPENPSGVDQ